MLPRLLTVCLMIFGNHVLHSDAEPVLVTSNNLAPRITSRALGDTSHCVSVTVKTTNMNAAMKDNAVATILMAYRLSDDANAQKAYFRDTFKTLYSTLNWNLFDNCGIYAVYTTTYINLSITVVTTSSNVTYELLVFASKP